MSHARIVSAEPWLIEESAYVALRQRLDARDPAMPMPTQASGEGMAFGSPRTSMADGVCTIPVCGPIFRYPTIANLIECLISGGCTVSQISQDLDAAMQDPACKSIVMTFDSPGGQAAGIPALASRIRMAASMKPVCGFAESICASAAYYLASACGELVASPGCMVGSIGCVMQFMDDSELMSKIGIKGITVRSEQSPKKFADPATPEGLKEYQEWANAVCDQFMGDVAKYRPQRFSTVAKSFGQGGVMTAKEAQAAGMVDRIASLDETMKKMSGSNRGRMAIARPVTASASQETAARSPVRLAIR